VLSFQPVGSRKGHQESRVKVMPFRYGTNAG
jgi:hypothetical protein